MSTIATASSLPRLDGRNVLITGATGGLGRVIAERLAELGANLALVSRAGVRIAGSGQLAIAADLADPDAPIRIADAVAGRWERVDALINNAATIGPIGPLATTDWQAWQRTIQVNLLAPIALCRLLVPRMPSGSSIVNLSGGGATSPRPSFGAYATSKAGLVRFTENLAAEVAGQGIRVNAVAPGAMNTPMLEAVLEAGADAAGPEFALAVEQKRQGGADPAKAAELVAWLVGRGSEGVSGRLLSAVWDPWRSLATRTGELSASDIYTLRRITPEDRGRKWD